MMNRIFKMITVGTAVTLVCGAMSFACPKHNVGPNAYNYRTPEAHKEWKNHVPHHGVKPNGFRHAPEFNHNQNFNRNYGFNHGHDFKSKDFKPNAFGYKNGSNNRFNHWGNHGFKPGFRHNPNFAPAPASTEATTTTENATEQTVK